MLSALVIGYGSIGARHARLLKEVGCAVAVVSRRSIDFDLVFSDIESAIKAHRPDYVVIANATNLHHETFDKLAKTVFSGKLLIEKPLFDRILPVPENAFSFVAVAYNLRFHPLIRRLNSLLAHERVLSAQAYVGQYLPNWRPGTDYRSCYSASSERGGGVLLDLSHDLDCLTRLFGACEGLAALGGQLSDLEITSDDVFALILKLERCPVVTLQVNYLDRLGRRNIIVNTADHTYEADLIGSTLSVDGNVEQIPCARDESYRAMHEALLAGQFDTACSVDEGLNTLELIKVARVSAKKMQWINR